MIVVLPDHSGFDLNLLLYYNQHSEDPKRVLYTLRSPVEGDPPLKFTAKCSGTQFAAAIERAQGSGEAIPGADIALPAFDLEAAFAGLEALIRAPATEEQVERSLRTNLAVAQRLAESGEPISTLNLRAEFDQIRNGATAAEQRLNQRLDAQTRLLGMVRAQVEALRPFVVHATEPEKA